MRSRLRFDDLVAGKQDEDGGDDDYDSETRHRWLLLLLLVVVVVVPSQRRNESKSKKVSSLEILLYDQISSRFSTRGHRTISNVFETKRLDQGF